MLVRSMEWPEYAGCLISSIRKQLQEGLMETRDLKKFLAGVGIASLLAGAGLVGGSTSALAADQPGGSG